MRNRVLIPRRKVALAFMAHPDDAEISCGGTLIRLRKLGWEVHITSVTAGDCGSMFEGPEETAKTRREEGTRAAELIGATFHTLNEPDGRLVYDREALQKSIDLFRRVAPTLVITMPLADYHADHEITGQLGRAASFVYAAPNASQEPLIDGSQVPYLYYCDGHAGVDRLGVPINPSTYVEVTEQLDSKIEMLSCHASQLEWLRAHNGIDEYLVATRQHSHARGGDIGVSAAEAFVQHRGHGHPADDLLSELFPLFEDDSSSNPSLQASY
ncbi:PIG-L deacetylase family protein [Rhodopirellula sp. SWK7]|uniref:PIG-L deacetylase family protein n=1 Tax=Rhodopirellula sp. SWK7 TaxID=595460 RepID=UPI0002BF142A|nr:PIG-L family deacetylase [Rhodopirellula sp. SWK7]EMI44058.1 N-acetylglucosaminyl phosphatidylinositol deacetylase [Rhodopirellula sp. SWK7]